MCVSAKMRCIGFCIILITASVKCATVTENYFNAGSERLEINVDSYFPLDGINELISDEELDKYGRQRISEDKFKVFHSNFGTNDVDMNGKRVRYDFKMKSRRAKRHAGSVTRKGESFDSNYDNVEKSFVARLVRRKRAIRSNSRKNGQVIGKYLKDSLYPDSGNEKPKLIATPNPLSPQVSQLDNNGFEFEYPYDYDQFHKEYYADLGSQEQNKLLFSPQPERKLSLINMTNEFFKSKTNESVSTNETLCNPDDWKSGVGFIALTCLVQQGVQSGFNQEIIDRFLSIARFWAIAYAIIGGFMWLSCGYCCCCLKCKIFKPDLIRKEARAYLVNNPPGISMDSEGKIQYYDPPEYELKAYRALEVKAFAFI